MSYLITIKIRGDVDTFTRALSERGDEFAAVVAHSQPAGAIHHRFGVGDDFVLVVDEWKTVEGFQRFFGDAKMREFVASVGADISTPPEITVAKAIRSADEF